MDIKSAEQVLIGLVLKYGKTAASLVIPDLTPSKFVYDEDGFGPDHSLIWTNISQIYLQNRADPTIAQVGYRQDYLRALVKKLEHEFGIFTFDANTLLEFADVVYKSGTIYRITQNAADIAKYAKNEKRV